MPGEREGLYPSISLVNHLRYVLDAYFGLDIGLLEDRLFWHSKGKVNFLDS